jgi:hypothetical protein
VRTLGVLLSGMLLATGCLEVPGPAGSDPLSDDAAPGGVPDAPSPCGGIEIGFDQPSDLDGWSKVDTGACDCGVVDRQLRFSNPGSACNCYFQNSNQVHDLRDSTVAITLAEPAQRGLAASLTIVFASGRALYFSAARDTLGFGECTPGASCQRVAHGELPLDAAVVHWRFRREVDAVAFDVSPDGATWSEASSTALALNDKDRVWLQVGSFESGAIDDELAFDDLRICPR